MAEELKLSETTPKGILKWKVKRLKVELGQYGLPKSGTRIELINRLCEFIRRSENKEVEIDQAGKITSVNKIDESIVQNENDLNNLVVNVEDFLVLKEEVKSLTDFVRNMYDQTKVIDGDHVYKLEKEIEFLRNECRSKDKVIELLLGDLTLFRNSKSHFDSIQNQGQLGNNDGWINVGSQNNSENSKVPVTPTLALRNRFGSLAVTNVMEEDEKHGGEITCQTVPKPNIQLNNRPSMLVNNNPENNNYHLHKAPIVPATIPGNSNYSEISKNGKKIFVTGDSIIKRIRSKEFNRVLQSGKAVIKSFPGSTANELNHYILPHLQNILPDIVIINAGTNNLSRDHKQTNDDLVKELLNVGITCKENGVNHVFISGLCYRNSRFLNGRIDDINIMLRNGCNDHNFEFIDNKNIQVDCHLWKDGVHLNDRGLEILANNYIKHLNVSFNTYHLYD